MSDRKTIDWQTKCETLGCGCCRRAIEKKARDTQKERDKKSQLEILCEIAEVLSDDFK